MLTGHRSPRETPFLNEIVLEHHFLGRRQRDKKKKVSQIKYLTVLLVKLRTRLQNWIICGTIKL